MLPRRKRTHDLARSGFSIGLACRKPHLQHLRHRMHLLHQTNLLPSPKWTNSSKRPRLSRTSYCERRTRRLPEKSAACLHPPVPCLHATLRRESPHYRHLPIFVQKWPFQYRGIRVLKARHSWEASLHHNNEARAEHLHACAHKHTCLSTKLCGGAGRSG